MPWPVGCAAGKNKITNLLPPLSSYFLLLPRSNNAFFIPPVSSPFPPKAPPTFPEKHWKEKAKNKSTREKTWNCQTFLCEREAINLFEENDVSPHYSFRTVSCVKRYGTRVYPPLKPPISLSFSLPWGRQGGEAFRSGRRRVGRREDGQSTAAIFFFGGKHKEIWWGDTLARPTAILLTHAQWGGDGGGYH